MADQVYMQLSPSSLFFFGFIKIVSLCYFVGFFFFLLSMCLWWRGGGGTTVAKLHSNIQPNSLISVFANDPKNSSFI